MNLIELTESIIKSIVKDEESLIDLLNRVKAAKEFPSEDENTIDIEVLVSEDDLGRVIGKNGKIANAIRMLVQASSSLKDNKYVKINIDKF